MINTLIICVCICASYIMIVMVSIDTKKKKEEASRCLECGNIPLKPDPRYDAMRASGDEKLLATSHFVRCSCGGLKLKQNETSCETICQTTCETSCQSESQISAEDKA